MRLDWRHDENGFYVYEKRRLGKPRTPDEWSKIGEPALARALASAHRLADESDERSLETRANGKDLFLSHRVVASLDERDAALLGLPASVPLGIRFDCIDQVMAEDFRLRPKWVSAGGIPVGVATEGALLKTSGRTYRIPQPIYDLVLAAEPLSGPLNNDERAQQISRFQAALDVVTDPAITTDDYLETVTVYYASAFSLSLGVKDDSFNFDPVLFERQVIEDAEAGERIDEVEAALLTPYHQELFTKDRFRKYPDARSAYALERGSIIVIDPALKNALQVVRDVAGSDAETRRHFVSNPTGFLLETLPEALADGIDRLFIETEQYSERVVGVDIWRKPVLPWVKPAPQSWLPESFGVKVGDDPPIEVPLDKVEELKAVFEHAKELGEQVVEWDGHTIPVSEQANEAIEALSVLKSEIDKAQDAPDSEDTAAEIDDAPAELADKRFLTVEGNLETVGFEAIAPLPTSEIALPASPPNTVKATLKSYQTVGFQWLASARLNNMPGVLLADDMGLGKTLQTLAFLAWNRTREGRGPEKPILVVAPTGLLQNWRQEIRKHLSEYALGVEEMAFGAALKQLKSNPATRSEISVGQTVLDVSSWREAGIVFTTYETMRDFHFSFAKVQFECIVFDEVQKLKNPSSQISRAARALNAQFKIGMSGTPVENRMQDLWSVMDVLWPGLLGASKDFEKTYPADNAKALLELHDRLFVPQNSQPAIGIRRLKQDELDGLPQKHEHVQRIEMPAPQAEAYQRIVQRALAKTDGLTPGDGMLKVLQDLRSISLHQANPRAGYEDMQSYVANSARLQATIGRLKTIAGAGEKALIFLESLEMQDFLADFIQREFGLKHRPYCISGKVSGQRRQAFVDDFQTRPDGFDVMILSPKAGGVGLTITRANHVIHLSRWWNPAIEDQSTDRVYRIGQNKPVHVYYPLAVHPDPQIAENSFDLKLDALLKSKRALAGRMLFPPENRDRDSQSLFGDVTSIETPAKQDDAPKPDQAALEEAAEDVTLPPDPPLSVPPAATPIGYALRYAEGVVPIYDEVFAGFPETRINLVRLIDPYAAWRKKGLRTLTEILLELARRCSGIDTIVLEVLHPGTSSLADRDVRNPEDIVDAVRKAFALQATGQPIPKVRFKLRRRTKDADFHDRFIILEMDGKNGIAKRTYTVPRGLDAFGRGDFDLRVFVEDEEAS